MKVGEKVVLPSGEEGVVVHVTPAIDETCDHEWLPVDDNPEYCSKCGLSFMRYIFCCCP